jgi:hypothetical protein
MRLKTHRAHRSRASFSPLRTQVRKAAGALLAHLKKTAPANALLDEDLTISMSIHLTRIPGRFIPKPVQM